jgi:hypothetical protein
VFPLIEEYMVDRKYNKEEVSQIKMYLQFVIERSKGEV